MSKKRFIPRTFTETLEMLCRTRGGGYIRAGEVNQSYLGRMVDINPSNISRWLKEEYEPSLGHLRKLADHFGISISQLTGEEPIPRIDGVVKSEDDEAFLRLYENANPVIKKLLQDQLRTLKDIVPPPGE